MYRQLFFIEGKLVGETSRQPVRYAGGFRAPESGVFFCGECGEVYAKIPVISNTTGKQSPWHSFRMLCRKCTTPYHSQVPGSIWLSWDEAFLLALPLPVLKLELDRHIESLEKER